MMSSWKRSALPLLSLLILAGCRQDMHDQPRFKPLAQSDFYADLRSARNPVEGTVARGDLREDSYFYTGKIGPNPGDYMPFPVTKDVLARGQERFNIYCAPCHSRVGDGNGMIAQRGFRRPPSYTTERLRKAPLGYFFDVIRCDARLLSANSTAGSLEHRGLSSGFAVEPVRDDRGCSSGAADSFDASGVSWRSGFRRDTAGARSSLSA